MEENDPEFDLSDGNKNRKKASINEALKSEDSYFKVGFDGPIKTFNKKGKLLNETIYNYKHEMNSKVLETNVYYQNGNLKEEINYRDNDTIGFAKSYYENGILKSEGKVINSKVNIVQENRGY